MRRILLLLPLLASCGGPALMLRAPEETEPPGTDEAKVVVYRDSFRNATKPYAFFDDEELIGFSETGTWFEVRCTPGEHFFFLHGVSSAGVRATLDAGKTYFLRVDSIPRFFRLQLRLTPIVPGMKEFDGIDDILRGLERRAPVDTVLAEYEEERADELEEALARLKTERYEDCEILSGDAGR
ncbi:MAG TPA: hypothetical protein VNM14_25290 [Planctomycetota bacterium]|jgi:hypothetical protein|nr:hypothetical protein [Planctomycetota bacterium]